MVDRVNRCYEQAWYVNEQILSLSGDVVLDLGFTTKAQRNIFSDRAKSLGVKSEIHYLDALKDILRSVSNNEMQRKIQ